MSQHAIPSTYVPGAVFSSMPIAYWDGCFQFLLDRLAVEYPEWPRTKRVNQALGDLTLMACGGAATSSLAVSYSLTSFVFSFANR